MREDTLRDGRFEVRVSFDARRGYVTHAKRAADHHCVVARRRINERLIGEDLDVKLVLDRAARLGRRKNQACAAVKRAAEEEWGRRAHVASFSSSPRHRFSIERGVDGGDHRVIGGLATDE